MPTKEKEEKMSRRLRGILDSDVPTTQEFLQLAEALTKYVQELDKRFSKRFESLEKKINGLSNGKLDESISSLVKSDVSMRVEKELGAIRRMIDGLSSEHKSALSKLNERVSNLRDGIDGKQGPQGLPGKSVDQEMVVSRLKNIMQKLIREELEKDRKERRVGGGGGTSAIGVKWALGNLSKKETPSGDIDGVNKTYTVEQEIHFVFSFAINGQVITDDEYTVSGKTITMNEAIPAGLSGTSFRITYA